MGGLCFNPRTPCGVRPGCRMTNCYLELFQSTHSLRSATQILKGGGNVPRVSIHALLAECDDLRRGVARRTSGFNPRTPCGVRPFTRGRDYMLTLFQSTHSLRSATATPDNKPPTRKVSIHALLAECDKGKPEDNAGTKSFNPRTPCGVRLHAEREPCYFIRFQSTHSLRSATAPNLIHCYSTKQIILCANLPKKTVIARLLFLSIYLSIFYSQCITPIADLPGNSCELEVGAQAMFNSL